ncbi:leucyl aminopeptidase [soil metagenome]
MEFQLITSNPINYATDCIIVGVLNNRVLSPTAALLDKTSQQHISKILKTGNFTGKLGQSLLLYHIPNINAKRVLLMGCGDKDNINNASYRKVVEKSIKLLNEEGSKNTLCCLTELLPKSYWAVRCAVESAEQAIYSFNHYKTNITEATANQLMLLYFNIAITDLPEAKRGLQEGKAIAAAVSYAKNLDNQPGNICTPSYLAQQATLLSKSSKALKTTIIDEKQMHQLKMGGILSVSQGSDQPAKLITVEYKGTHKSTHPIVLIGKGITFDSGGLSLKPAAAMDEMKYDMCGAAAILGVIKAAAELHLPLNIVVIIAAAENLINGAALKPGDIITTHSGQTVEILNTDAEGRLILCDALSYCQRFQPEIVIDAATLTGSIVAALGMHAAGLFSNDTALSQDLLKASEESGDRVWQMPLWDEYQEEIASNFADMANIGSSRYAGSIVAACYLSRFVKQLRWAHLDIAGVAHKGEKTKGATGRPVPLLLQYLLNRCP